MKRSDVVKEMTRRLTELVLNNRIDEKGFLWCGEQLMKVVDNYMSPKYGGKHQSSFDLALGNPTEWSKK